MRILKRIYRQLYLLLLPLFFVLHHYLINYTGVTAGQSLLLLTIHLAITMLLVGIVYLLVRNFSIAALISATIMLFLLFFGWIKDFIFSTFTATLSLQYIILTAGMILSATIFWRLLDSGKLSAARAGGFFNLLFALWIVIELIQAIPLRKKFSARFSTINFTGTKQAENPSVYVVVADEYPRNDVLKTVFGYDNSAFWQGLADRGFIIDSNSRSNYDLTQFSMASMFNMDYLPVVGLPENADYSLAALRINKAPLWRALEDRGYRIVNYSIFELNDIPPLENAYKRNYNKEYFKRTLPGRFYYDFPAFFHSGLERKATEKSDLDKNLVYNTKRLSAIRQHRKTAGPEFLYLHLLMPHFPYYFDSSGNRIADENIKNEKNFPGYLAYSNKEILKVIDQIKALPGQKVIYLLSDHGYRQSDTPRDFYFNNLSALYASDNKVSLRQRSTSINQFRNIINQVFQQNFPYLADSTVHLTR